MLSRVDQALATPEYLLSFRAASITFTFNKFHTVVHGKLRIHVPYTAVCWSLTLQGAQVLTNTESCMLEPNRSPAWAIFPL